MKPADNDRTAPSGRSRRDLLLLAAAGAAGAAVFVAGQFASAPPTLTAAQVTAHAKGAMTMLKSLVPELVNALRLPPAARQTALTAVTQKKRAILASICLLDPMVADTVAAECNELKTLAYRGDAKRMIADVLYKGDVTLWSPNDQPLLDGVTAYFGEVPDEIKTLQEPLLRRAEKIFSR